MTAKTLLGYLAQFGAFSTQSELLCTQGLAHLLEKHPCAGSAMAEKVTQATGVAINESLTWIPEALQKDGGKPDLEARTGNGTPLVKIEAKLGAAFGAGQFRSYWNDLRNRNGSEGALLVLVPAARLDEAAKAVADALCLEGTGPWRVRGGHRHAVATLAWEELFDALGKCQDEMSGFELEQLREMYRVLSGDYVAPLADIKDLLEWRERTADFISLVDKATRRLTTKPSVYPMGTEPVSNTPQEMEELGYRRRYVCRHLGDIETCFSIGVRDPFANTITPIWMRFRKDTGSFERIKKRIKAASINYEKSGGHIWIPMNVEIDKSAEEMIQSLVEQAQKIMRVAYQDE